MSRITVLAWLPRAGGCRLCSALLGREEAGKPPLRLLCRQPGGNALVTSLEPVAQPAAGTGLLLCLQRWQGAEGAEKRFLSR